jgi:chitinase
MESVRSLFIVISIVLVSIQVTSIASAVTISGHVYDAEIMEPIKSAELTIQSYTLQTNVRGYYNFSEGKSSSRYTITCNADGYSPKTKNVTTDENGDTKVDFYLIPAFRLVGFITDWGNGCNGDGVGQIQFNKLTHINYAFLLPNSDGTFDQKSIDKKKLENVVAMAHDNGTKILISVGGFKCIDGPCVEQFETVIPNQEKRKEFVKNLIAFVEKYELDGVDIDWEFPNDKTSNAYLELMKELRDAMGNNKLLTSDVPSSGVDADNIPTKIFNLVNFLNIMAYDAPKTQPSEYSDATDALNYWKNRSLPATKIVLGVPFYALPNEKSLDRFGKAVGYCKLVYSNRNSAYKDVSTYNKTKVYYNGIPTVQKKTDLAKRNASGIMIYPLDQDTNDTTSLLNAIYLEANGFA